MVEWSLARQVTRLAAGGEPVPDLGLRLDEMAERAERELTAYTLSLIHI